jgi:hypothetical protein
MDSTVQALVRDCACLRRLRLRDVQLRIPASAHRTGTTRHHASPKMHVSWHVFPALPAGPLSL